MLLAVDIGNSRTKFGVFDGEILKTKFFLNTNESDDESLRSAIGENLNYTVTRAIICSVVPEFEHRLGSFLVKSLGIDPVFVANDFDFGITINYQPLSSAGTDRLVNAFAAVERYGTPCVVCSFGTALTIDFVDRNRVLQGGIIAPGMQTMAKALNLLTAKLPEVVIEKPDSVIQTTTAGSIQSGVVYGYFGLVDSLVSRIRSEVGGEPQVIATGGFADLVAANCHGIDIIDGDLLLSGLNLLNTRIYPE